jgi:uncharacterized membrane protein
VTEPEPAGRADAAASAEPAVDVQEHQDGGAPVQYSLRRAPRYRVFVLTGVLIGVIIAAVLTVAFPNNGDFSARALFGYLGAILALVFGLVGALVAIFLERPRRR